MTEALTTSGKSWLEVQARSRGKYHKKRDNRSRSKQKEHNSKGYYSFKGERVRKLVK
jgi:hypothetical protein